MTINYNSLFQRIGKAFYVAKGLLLDGSTTTPTNLNAFLTLLQTEAPQAQEYVQNGTTSGLTSFQNSVTSAIGSLVTNPITRLITQAVQAEDAYAARTSTTALDYLIAVMREDGESLDKSTITTVIDYGSAHTSSSGPAPGCSGDGVLVVSTKRGDGLVNEFIYSETLNAVITSVSSTGQATWTITGQPSVANYAATWPAGSGTNRAVTSNVASTSSSLVYNGTMETADSVATSLPIGWIEVTGTAGTNFMLTDVAVNLITVASTPTAGYYTVRFTDRLGKEWETIPLAYNAAASTVQSALRSLTPLASVTVTDTGTSPNLTHTCTMYGVPYPGNFAIDSHLTGGTITPTQPTPGCAYTVRGGRVLKFVGGVVNTEVQRLLSVAVNQQFAVNLWLSVDVVPAAGVLQIALVDGVSGSVISDDQGVPNSFDVTLSTLTTNPMPYNSVFRIPVDMPNAVYLRLKLTTPLSSGSNLFIDEIVAATMTELYAGGLNVAAFSGDNDFVVGDVAQIIVTNDRGGELHEYLNRSLNLRTQRKLFPTSVSGSQSDSLIS